MSNLKGTDITTIRSLVQKSGIEKEQELKKLLSDENFNLYQSTVAISWIPVKIASEIMSAAGEILYPSIENKVWEMGRECAHDNLKDEGVYNILFKNPSVKAIFNQGTAIWKTFYDTGVPIMEVCDEKNRQFIFCVKNDPELTPVNLDFIAGYIEGMFDVAGKKDIHIKIENNDPHAWRWIVSWQD